MDIRLKSVSTSFATRERARQVVADAAPNGVPVVLDIEGTMASPSFLAQLLTDLSLSASDVTVVGGDAHHNALVGDLIEKLGLHTVRLAELA